MESTIRETVGNPAHNNPIDSDTVRYALRTVRVIADVKQAKFTGRFGLGPAVA